MQKYGAGPHRVEIELHFPGEAPSSFVIEMAPLDLMAASLGRYILGHGVSGSLGWLFLCHECSSRH